jgi:Helix-turn-helix domain
LRLSRIESMLKQLVERQAVKEFYTPEEFARIVGREAFTCREYCRLGRIRALKKASGRGKHASWVIPHDELLRFQREGLLPDRRHQPNTADRA